MNEKVLKSLLPIVAAFVPVLASIFMYLYTTKKADLSIYNISQNNLVNEKIFEETLRKDLKISVGGIEVEKLFFGLYSLKNTGNVAILPKDFIVPISFSAKEPWELYAIFISSPNNNLTDGSNIKLSTPKVGEIELSPALLNPTDEIFITTYCIKKNSSNVSTEKEANEKPNIIIKGRIVDVVNIVKKQEDLLRKDFSYYFLTTVFLQGYDVYFFVVIALLLFVIQVYLFIKARYIKITLSVWNLILYLVSVLLVLSTSEIILFLFVNRLRLPIWPGCYVLLVIHCGLIIYLVVKIYLINLKNDRENLLE